MERKKIFFLLSIVGFAIVAINVHAFIGPGVQQPGSGGGQFYLDTSKNIGFGSSLGTPSNNAPDGAFGKVFMIASTTSPGIGLKNLAPNPLARTYLIHSRNDGVLSVFDDKANFVRLAIQPNGDVIIASIGATSTLTVNGDVSASGLVSASVLSGSYNGIVSANNVSAGAFGSSTGGGNFNFKASLGISTSTNVGLPQALSVYGGGYFRNSVSISTTTATQALVVSGNVDVSGQFLGQPSDTASNPSFSWDGYGSSGVFRTSNNSVGVSVDGKEVLRASSSGRIGIGTVTTPDAPLHILVSSSDPYRGITIQNASNTTSAGIAFRNSGTSYSWYVGRMDAGNNDADLVFTHGPGSDPSTFTPELVLTKGDRIGVGTTTPSYKLDVQGGQINVSGGLCINADCKTTWSDIAGTSGWTNTGSLVTLSVPGNTVIIGTSTASNNSKIEVYSSSITGSGATITKGDAAETGTSLTLRSARASSSQYAFLRAISDYDNTPVEQLTILGNGHIGVGTTTPGASLHIIGNQIVSGNVTAGSFTGALAGTLTAGNIAAGEFGSIVGGGYYAFGSKLSIGTSTTYTSPVFYVYGANDEVGRINGNGTNNAYLSFYHKGVRSGYILADDGANGTEELLITQDSATASRLRLGPGAATFVIDNSGNIGIGTSTPDVQLVLTGDMRIRGGPDALRLNSGNVEYGAISMVDGNGRVNIYENAASSGSVYSLAEEANRISMGASGISFYNANAGVVGGTITWSQSMNVSNSSVWISPRGNSADFYVSSTGRIGIGTTSPTSSLLQVMGNVFISATTTLAGNLDMKNKNINNVNKITVGTIDPLYEIEGRAYATFPSAIVGGVNEEYVGQGKTEAPKNEYVLDFNNMAYGSDLWVWRKVVDFSKETVNVFTTPYGEPQVVSYEIKDNVLIFRSMEPTEFSFRLIGKRFDWKSWPTYVSDPDATPNFIIH